MYCNFVLYNIEKIINSFDSIIFIYHIKTII